ncbi:MAG TPA: EamA family transporter, partial [Gaiellaceae bacterium]
MSEAAFPVEPARHRRPRLGYLMAAVAAALWGLNGGVSKTILATGLSSERLAQVRSLGAAAGLVAILAVTAPNRLRLTRRELPYLVAFGMGGLAFVQFFYFLAIHRLEIGIALLVEYLAPLLVALWSRFVQHAPVRRRIWVALGLALTGLGLIVDVFGGGKSLSIAGLAFALGGAFAYALYVLLAEHVVGGRDAVSLLAWGSALRHVSATTAGIVAMLEPVVGAIVGWLWLNESLDAVQLVGAAIVL